MKIILTKYVKRLGKIGDIVSVKGGYGRNYLLPFNFAVLATQANLAMFEERKATLEAQNTESLTLAHELANILKGAELIFIKQAADDGRLFGSVTKKEIADSLNVKFANASLNQSSIVLNSQIKFIGIHSASVELHPDVVVSIVLSVAKTESEAMKALVAYNTPDTVETNDTIDTTDTIDVSE